MRDSQVAKRKSFATTMDLGSTSLFTLTLSIVSEKRIIATSPKESIY